MTWNALKPLEFSIIYGFFEILIQNSPDCTNAGVALKFPDFFQILGSIFFILTQKSANVLAFFLISTKEPLDFQNFHTNFCTDSFNINNFLNFLKLKYRVIFNALLNLLHLNTQNRPKQKKNKRRTFISNILIKLNNTERNKLLGVFNTYILASVKDVFLYAYNIFYSRYPFFYYYFSYTSSTTFILISHKLQKW